MFLEEISYKVYLLIIGLILILCVVPLVIRFFYCNNISFYNKNSNNKNINLDNKNNNKNIQNLIDPIPEYTITSPLISNNN